jgi:hypothetical protein
MNINHFLEGLTWVWIIGGILLLPLNSFVGTFLISIWLKIDPKTWLERVMAPSWILQIIWNLIFFSISSFLGSTETGKISYTLVRKTEARADAMRPTKKTWEYHFYSNNGKTEIPNDSEQATPFQKLLEASNPIGLEENQAYGVNLMVKLDDLSEKEVRAYIDQYNTAHGDNPVLGFFISVIYAVACPFLCMLGEAFVIAFVVFCFSNPLLAAVIYGPIIYRLGKAGAFKGAY